LALGSSTPHPFKTYKHLRNGYILPHRDDLSSCGDYVMGVSLGDERIMKLQLDKEAVEANVGQVSDDSIWNLEIQARLPSGSCYIQKDSIRYLFAHSIEPSRNKDLPFLGQRMSIMIREPPEDKFEHKWR